MSTAIYWDYQNVQLKSSSSSTILVDKIIEFTREKGEIGTLRAYAKWSSPTIKAETAQNLASAGFELIHVPSTRKNAVDLVISADLGKAAMMDTIETFILITSDGDFVPALANLRRAGKKTVVIANPGVVSERLQIAADDFLPLNLFQFHPEPLEESPIVSISENENESIVEPPIVSSEDEALDNALKLLQKAVLESMKEELSLRFSSIATKLYELEPNLDLKKITSLPKKRFQALVNEAVKQGVVVIKDVEGWQELNVPEVAEGIEDVPLELQAGSGGRQLEESEKEFIEECLSSLDQERTHAFTFLLTQLRHKRNEIKGSLSNSELKQLLVSMIETEIFRKHIESGAFQISPLWKELWDKFSEEYRL
ncbi:MAG: NYN domain-containing protein [Candidatus Hodarchaeales archaeon]